MDQQERVDVADNGRGAGSANYPPGASVYDADGEKLGTVSDRQDKDDFLVVHKGRLFSHEAYVPRAAIDHSDVNGVHLRVRKDDLNSMNQTPLPEPTAPIRRISGAPEVVAVDQPPMVPIAPPVPAPDMGVAAVAATAFSNDATREPAPATGSSAQNGLRQATDVVREQSAPVVDTIREQVGPLFDTLHERVEPIAEQVKDRASAVAQQQMTSAAEGFDSAASAVNAVGDQLRENNFGALSQYTDMAAEQIEKAAAWLRSTTPEELARNVEDFAKKQPELFAAGAVALGLIGLRLLRNTERNDEEKKDG
jgi:hypothetical protein